jgi:alpha-galactosidase
MWRVIFCVIILVIFASVLRPLDYAYIGDIAPLFNIASTPPMGWNSWNCFNADVTDELIRETVDAMVEKNLLSTGYQYIVIDDGWQDIYRDSEGNLQSNQVKFPHGMKSIGDYIHSRGFKFGLYTSVGRTTCEGYPGSYDNEFRDMKTFADWGVDFVKIDWCTAPRIWWPFWNYRLRYNLMTQAIQSTQRPMVISMCNWGFKQPWSWEPNIAHMYRMYYDIRPSRSSIETIVQEALKLKGESRENHWLDMDMLEIGNGLSTELSVYHFYWWCKLRSPLMLSCDIRTLSDDDLALITNENYIRMNQYGEDISD